MISNLLAFIFKCIASTRLYPRANALQVELVLDCKMVLHWPELSRGLGYELSMFYICRFGGWELWHWLNMFHHSSCASKHSGESAEPQRGFSPTARACSSAAICYGEMNQLRV